MAKLLITTIEKPEIDYIKDPWVNMTDDNEEYFAETLERIAAICTDRYIYLKNFNP
jgi:predicted O-linked N-acetylglucosamine transferase (SPINDLY family)